MIKQFLLITIVICGLKLSAQTAISGYVDTAEIISHNSKIYLIKASLQDMSALEKTETIASANINEQGYFQFNRNLIDDKEAVYRLQLAAFGEKLGDTRQLSNWFLFSKTDTIVFEKSEILFSQYANTNSSDTEWQGLRNYESKLKSVEPLQESTLSDSYIKGLKSYTKDSLDILIVKLIGIKQLDNKSLLDTDVLKNTDYYLALLSELKESDIERSEYLFLENKLAFLTTELAENKYQKSSLAVLVLGIAVLGLLLLLFLFKRKKTESFSKEDSLSKQERTIQTLILAGKTNKEIANELFISLSTVKTHISNIYSKLRVSDRRELLLKYQN